MIWQTIARKRGIASRIFWVLAIVALSQCGKDDVDQIDPAVRFTFPAEFTVLSGLETIRVIANDNDELKSLTFAVDGNIVDVQTVAPFVLLLNTAAYADCTAALGATVVSAIAEDKQGNTSTALRQFYTDNEGLPPLPVEILPGGGVTKHTATLAWTRSLEYDFSHYSLWRDTTEDVTAFSDSVDQTDDILQTVMTDLGLGVTPFGLDENTDYFYRVFVHDTAGAFALSDSAAMVTTLLPRPVVLTSGGAPTKYTVDLSWAQLQEDVAYYRLHRGPDTALTDLDSIARIDPSRATYLDSNLTANTDYFYYMFAIDSAGYTNPFTSLIAIPARTDSLDQPFLMPTPQALDKYSATIQWQPIPAQEDSSWLTIFRSTTGTVDSTDREVARLSVPTDGLRFTDTGLSQAQDYQFRVRHHDSQGNTQWSDLAELTTLSIEDVWSGGLGISNQGKYDLELKWDDYNYLPDDFSNYSLLRDGVEVYNTTDRSEVNRIDAGLSRKTTYTYTLIVTDTSGASGSVIAQATTRDIFAAELLLVEPTILWFYRLAWKPSAEPASEFLKYAIVRSTNPDENFGDTNGDDIVDCVAAGTCSQLPVIIGGQYPANNDTVIVYDDLDPNLITSDLNALPIYNYAVLTYDNSGGYSASNVVGDTLYSEPSPVVLRLDTLASPPIHLLWTRADWNNPTLDAILFDRYEIWRNTEQGKTLDDPASFYQKIGEINDINVTSHPDGVPAGEEFAYTIVLVDKVGRKASSNELTAATPP